MLKRHLIAAGYAIALPLSSTALLVLVAVGVEGAAAGVRRLTHR